MTKKHDKANTDTWFDNHWKSHAFQGELAFDLVLEFLGRRDTKKCKVVYAFTPGEWEFYDPKTKTIQSGTESCIYHVDIEAVPELRQKADGTWKRGKPYWTRYQDFIADDILSHDMQDTILNAIDEKCRAEDAERRRAAGL